MLLDADSFFADADAVVADFLVEVELEVEEADFFSSCTAGFRRGGADAAADWSDFISALHVWLGDGRVGRVRQGGMCTSMDLQSVAGRGTNVWEDVVRMVFTDCRASSDVDESAGDAYRLA